MRLESEDIINQPPDIVYPLVRDEMDKIVPFLPDIDRIEIISRELRDDGRISLINQWHAHQNSVPAIARKFVKPEMFSWKDYALWDDDNYSVDFRLESLIANDLFDAQGTNYFGPTDEEGKTLLRVQCDITLYPERFPGIPKFLARKIQPTVEAILKKMIGPNLTSLGRGLTAYFDAQS